MSQPSVTILGMCWMCEGATLDEVRFHLHGSIERVGWAVVPVYGGCPDHSWAYTIGLSSNFDHPELVVVGQTPDAAGNYLNAVGKAIRSGRSFEAGDTLVLAGYLEIRFAPVPRHHFLRDAFAMWTDYHGALGSPRPEPRALELVLPGRAPKLDRLRRPDASHRPPTRRKRKRPRPKRKR